uniref:Titin n=1 Tax=Hippocampus comes TaxID=109280 RepID=A0A3Q2ZHQ9_HIPCM
MVTVENASGSKTAFVNVRVLDTPGAPQNLLIKEVTKDSVSLIWDAPLIDGGSRVRNYIVEKRESTRKAYSTVCANCHKSSWKVGELEEGKMYFFRILAENEYGIGLPVETFDPIKASERPLPPGKVSLLELAPKDTDSWSVCTSGKATEALVSNLLKGEEYQFRVVAVNDKGRSDPRQLAHSVVAKDLVIEPSVRPKTSCYSVQVGHDLKIEVPVAGHPKPTISWSKDGVLLKQTTRVNVTDSAHQTTLAIKDATREDGGMYSITVANDLQSKEATVEVITLDKPGPPSGPVKLEDIMTRHSVKLRWAAPQYNGGSLITGYVVEKRDLPEGKWMKASFANVTDLEFTVTGLKENSKYDFRVIARNAAGAVSKPSESSGSITAKDEVDPPKCETDAMYNQTLVINAGDTFSLEAKVDGKPIPTAQWFKGDVEVENSSLLSYELRLSSDRTAHQFPGLAGA